MFALPEIDPLSPMILGPVAAAGGIVLTVISKPVYSACKAALSWVGSKFKAAETVAAGDLAALRAEFETVNKAATDEVAAVKARVAAIEARVGITVG